MKQDKIPMIEKSKYDRVVRQRDELLRRYSAMLNSIKNQGIAMSAKAQNEQQEVAALFTAEDFK